MKTKTSLYSLFALFFALFIISSCEKKEEEPDKTALLTNHVWNFDKLTTSSTDPDILLAVNLLGALMTGGTLTIAANGTYTMTLLGLPDAGTWELNDNETTFTLNKGTDDESVQEIIKLTSTVFETKEMMDDEDYGEFDINYHWKK
jgi:hypothetical protein